MDAQQMHDDQLAKRRELEPDSKQRLEVLLAKKVPKAARVTTPYEQMLRNHPGLTSEKLDQMLDAFGG